MSRTKWSNHCILTNNEIIQLTILGAGLIGLGLAWKWELIGGIITLVCFVVLAGINPTVLQGGPFMFIMPGTAILFIVLWEINRKTIVKNQ